MACFSIYNLTPISSTSGLGSTGNTRNNQQFDVCICQCDIWQNGCLSCEDYTKGLGKCIDIGQSNILKMS